MDSVPGQTFLNYAYSWGASIVILGALFKLTHLPGANPMLFIGMGTEVLVFFLSAFDRPFDKSSIDKPLDIHMSDEPAENATVAPVTICGGGNAPAAPQPQGGIVAGGTIIIGGGSHGMERSGTTEQSGGSHETGGDLHETAEPISFDTNTQQAQQAYGEAASTEASGPVASQIITPAPAVSAETAEAMEAATTSYVDHLNELNAMLEKVAAQSARLATDSEEMENLNRTLTGISRVYEMQLKSASQQITTQDEINEQTKRMAQQIQELNAIYTRMIEAMTVNMNPLAASKSEK